MPEQMSEAAAHGFTSRKRTREEHREHCRKAGRASGRKRRELREGERGPGQRELPIKQPVRLVGREEFYRREFARRLELGLNPHEGQALALWQHYCCLVRVLKVQGQGFLTCNRQRAEAMAKAGLPRSTRSIQRYDAILAEMGLLRRFHDKRSGQRNVAGRKDRVRIQFASSFVIPPLEQQQTPASPGVVVAGHDQDCDRSAVRDCRPATPARAAPPDGGRHEAPATPANSSDEREGPDAVGERPDVQPPEPVCGSRADRLQRAREGFSASLRDLRRDRR